MSEAKLTRPLPTGIVGADALLHAAQLDNPDSIPRIEVANRAEAAEAAAELSRKSPIPLPPNYKPIRPENVKEVDISTLSDAEQREAQKTLRWAANAAQEFAAQDAVELPPQPPPPPPPPVSTADAASEARRTPPKTCPHCGWDQSENDPLVISDKDRTDFMRSVLSGDRFRKVFKLFGGRVQATFRSKLVREDGLVIEQCNLDVAHHRIEPFAYLAQSVNYDMACCLESIAFEDGSPIVFDELVTVIDGQLVRRWKQPDEVVRRDGLNDAGLRFKEIFSAWNSTLFNQVYSAQRAFSALMERLQVEFRANDFFEMRPGHRD